MSFLQVQSMTSITLTKTQSSDPSVNVTQRPILNPAEIYLLRMTTNQSKVKVAQIADSVAKIFRATDYKTCDWGKCDGITFCFFVHLTKRKTALRPQSTSSLLL